MTLTAYIQSVVTGEPFPFTGTAAEIALDAIGAAAGSFYAVTKLGNWRYGQIGYCPCEAGHDGLPYSWIQFQTPDKLTEQIVKVTYCDASI